MQPGDFVIAIESLIWKWARAVWWLECPAFLVLVLRFSFERGCMNPYELLEPLMRRQSTAVAIALVYLSAHVWLLAVLVLLARQWPRGGERLEIMTLERRLQLAGMAGALALEAVPRVVWVWLYHGAGMCR
ncbi:MAG TPA: hypothetical protein VH458_23945 [Vicinamibacterales bacterium]